jgi:hypothetical protein
MPREIIQAVPYPDGVSRRVTLAWGWSPEKSDVVALLEIDEHDPKKFEARREIGPTGQIAPEFWDVVTSIPLYGSEIEGLIRAARRAEKTYYKLVEAGLDPTKVCTCTPNSSEACSNCRSLEVKYPV